MHSPVCSHVLMEACSPGTAGTNHPCIPETYTISKDSLLDKIKGGWAGQAIGCTYGGPTEFKYCGTMIQDYVPIEWYDGYIKWWYDNVPGLYDDVYMDLTFVDVFDRLGLDAPADSFAMLLPLLNIPSGMLIRRHDTIFCKESCRRHPVTG